MVASFRSQNLVLLTIAAKLGTMGPLKEGAMSFIRRLVTFVKDPKVPKRRKALVLVASALILSPIDLLPEKAALLAPYLLPLLIADDALLAVLLRQMVIRYGKQR